MEKMAEDDMDEMKRVEEEEKKKEKEILEKLEMTAEELKRINDLAGTTFSLIDIKADPLSKEELARLNVKRKREKKDTQVISGKAKERKVTKLSSSQKIFNILSKSATIDTNAVRNAATTANTQLSSENIEFFVSLGEARSNLKRFGIPGTICKHPFHAFVESTFYQFTQVITNDINVIEVFYVVMFNISAKENGYKEYALACANSRIKEFSFYTNKSFVCDTVKSGYIQDYSAKVTLIASKPITKKDAEEFAEAFTKKSPGTIYLKVADPRGGEGHTFMQYKTTLLVAPGTASIEDISNLLRSGDELQCVNSKNSLQRGLKQLKTEPTQGSYLNIHEAKTTDFSPSCLFIQPGVENPKIFISAELDTNTLYNYLAQNLLKYEGDLRDISLPPNTIFWDNFDSAVELLAFIKLVNNPANRVNAQILYIVTKFNEYRANFMAWKRIYSNFESIVLSFYDKITNKFQIDSIIALDKKVIKFITDFQAERKSKAYMPLLHILDYLPNVPYMQNFAATSAALDLAYAIARLIRLLDKSDSKKIGDFFKTVGLSCFNCLVGGKIPMIPKARSKCAFVGGIMSNLDPEVFQESFKDLVDSYKKDVLASIKKDSTGAVTVDDMTVLDELIKDVVTNTIKMGDSAFLKDNITKIMPGIFSKDSLVKSLREDIAELLKKESVDAIKLKGDFLADKLFMNYLASLDIMKERMGDDGDDLDAEDLASYLEVKSEAPEEKERKLMKFKSLGRKKKKEVKIRGYKRKGNIKVKKDKAKRLAKNSKNSEKLLKDLEEIVSIEIKAEPEEKEEEKEKPKDEIKEEEEEEEKEEEEKEEEIPASKEKKSIFKVEKKPRKEKK